MGSKNSTPDINIGRVSNNGQNSEIEVGLLLNLNTAVQPQAQILNLASQGQQTAPGYGVIPLQIMLIWSDQFKKI